MKEKVLIVGGGISGLAAAGFLCDEFDCTLIERENELGGYCRTIDRNGYIWDYSGHFFHFRHQWVSDYVHSRTNTSDILRVKKLSRVRLGNSYIDAPLQYHIDQLPKEDMLQCLTDIHDAQMNAKSTSGPEPFLNMLYRRYGDWLTDNFLKPYNEKLYVIPMAQLDAGAMGRFFPHIEFAQLLRLLARREHIGGYNEYFSYHRCGARGYVEALTSYVPGNLIHLGTECSKIDLKNKRAHTSMGVVAYDRMIITSPLPCTLGMAGMEFPKNAFTANKVLIFNIGFDRESARKEHWLYFPEPHWPFYRVGFYSNILGQERMSLYVEVGLGTEMGLRKDELLSRVLEALRHAGIVEDHQIVDYKTVLMDPAYVHLKPDTATLVHDYIATLNADDVFPLGRYGEWKYCSIEDSIVSAAALAKDWGVSVWEDYRHA